MARLWPTRQRGQPLPRPKLGRGFTSVRGRAHSGCKHLGRCRSPKRATAHQASGHELQSLATSSLAGEASPRWPTRALSDPYVVSVPEAAQLLGISKDLAYDLARRGELPGAFQLGRRWRVSLVKLLAAVHGPENSAAQQPG
ncbi:MAG: helix-turn-helix domain-containing protein [Acidimicrobiales bacterium]